MSDAAAVDSEILRLKEMVGVPTDSALASLLEVQRSAIAQWKKRGRVPEKAKLRAAVIARHRREGGAAARDKFEAPEDLRLLSRSIALRYLVWTIGDEQQNADSYTFRVAAIDQVERVARTMIVDLMCENGDPDYSYKSLFSAADLVGRINGRLAKLDL